MGTNHKKNKQLTDAVTNGNITEANEALKHSFFSKGADANSTNYQDKTALYIACENGYFELAELLIQNKANVNNGNGNNELPLFIAIKNNYLNIVKLLIENKASIEKEYWSKTPADYSLELGNKEIFDYLIQKGAKLNVTNKNLFYTAEFGFIDIFDMLISKGADVHSKDSLQDTLLIAAAKKGQLSFIKHIIPSIKDINEENQWSCSALSCAIIYEQKEVADFLLDKGATGKIIKERFKHFTITCCKELEVILKQLHTSFEVKPFLEKAMQIGFKFDQSKQTSQAGIYIESSYAAIMFSTVNMCIDSCVYAKKGGDNSTNVILVKAIGNGKGELLDHSIYDIVVKAISEENKNNSENHSCKPCKKLARHQKSFDQNQFLTIWKEKFKFLQPSSALSKEIKQLNTYFEGEYDSSEDGGNSSFSISYKFKDATLQLGWYRGTSDSSSAYCWISDVKLYLNNENTTIKEMYKLEYDSDVLYDFFFVKKELLN